MRKKQSGQGIIEYAGAIVAAATLVAVVLSAGPDGISQLFTNVLDSTQAMLNGHIAGISS